MTTVAKTTAEEGVADAKRLRTKQEAQNSSSSSVEPKAISELCEVLSDERQNIEDLLIGPFNHAEQQTRICQLDDVVIDGSKDVPMEFVKVQVRNFFRAQDIKPNEHKTSEEAAMMVEIGAKQVLEVCSRSASQPEREILACGHGLQWTSAARSPTDQTMDGIGT